MVMSLALRKHGTRSVSRKTPRWLSWNSRCPSKSCGASPACRRRRFPGRGVQLGEQIVVSLGRQLSGTQIGLSRDWPVERPAACPFARSSPVSCSQPSLAHVGGAESGDLAELLAARAEVELAAGALLEDVEAAVREELRAVVGAPRSGPMRLRKVRVWFVTRPALQYCRHGSPD